MLNEGSFVFRQAPLGAGGFVTGMSIAPDASWMIHTPDVWNAYCREPGDVKWRIAFDRSTLDQADWTPWLDGNATTDDGCFCATISKSAPSTAYASFYGFMWKTTNKGLHWTRTALTQRKTASNGGLGAQGTPDYDARLFQSTIAIHPTNPNIVIHGTNNDGVWWTSDGFATFTAASGIPAMSDLHKYLVAIDQNDPNYVYVHVVGSGLYRSTTGVAGAFALMAGSPTTANCLVVSQSGKIYICMATGTNRLWTCPRGSTTWTNIVGSSSSFQVAVDPFDEDHLVTVEVNGGWIKQTYDAGATWISAERNATVGAEWFRGSGEISWLSNRSKPMYPAQIMFDPVTVGKLWICEGVGVNWSMCPAEGVDPTAANPWVVHDFSFGNEELIPYSGSSIPGHPMLLFTWDKPIWQMRYTDDWRNMWGMPTEFNEVFPAATVTIGYAADYAIDDPDFVVAVVGSAGNYDGYSINGGQSWKRFTVPCPGFGGYVAVSNKNFIMRTATNNGPGSYSKDGGQTWSNIAFGNYNPVNYWNGANYTPRQTLAADKQVPGKFAALVNNIKRGVATITIASPAVLTNPNPHSLNAGDPITLSTTGALPTGFNTSSTYYVKNPTSTTFELAATAGGASINTSGTQSGTHYWNRTNGQGRDIAGVWQTTDGGDNWVRKFNGCIQTTVHPTGGGSGGQYWSCLFTYIPGHAGHMIYADLDTANTENCICLSTDDGATWTDADPLIRGVTCAAIGAPAPGSTWPSVYFYGKYNGVIGYYGVFDWFVSPPVLMTVTPFNFLINPNIFAADMNVFGRLYVGLQGQAFAVSDYYKEFTLVDQTPPVTSAPPPGNDIFVFMSDSLGPSRGADNAGTARDMDEDPPVLNTSQYVNYIGKGGEYQTVQNYTAPVWFPDGSYTDTTTGRISPAEDLLERYQELTSDWGRGSSIVPTGVGGSALLGATNNDWDPSTPGTYLVNAQNANNYALPQFKAIGPGYRIRGVWICLTSNDVNSGGYNSANIRAAWLGEIDYVRANFDGVSDETPIVLSGPCIVGTTANTARADIEWAATQRPNVYVVHPPLTASADNLHPLRAENRIWGAAVAEAFYAAPEPTEVEQFSIPSIFDAPVNSTISSQPWMVTGIGLGVQEVLSSETGVLTSVNGSPFTQANKSVYWGDMISAQLQSSSSNSTLIQGDVTIGDKTASFNVTTVGLGGTSRQIMLPDDFSYMDNGKVRVMPAGMNMQEKA